MNYRNDIERAQKMLPEVVEQLHQARVPYVDFPDGYASPAKTYFNKGTDGTDWDGLHWHSAVVEDGGNWTLRVSIKRNDAPWGIVVDRLINSNEVFTHYSRCGEETGAEVMAHNQPGFPGLDQAIAQDRLLAEVK